MWNCPQVITTRANWRLVNTGSGNSLVPPGSKPLSEPMWTQISVTIWHQWWCLGSVGNESWHWLIADIVHWLIDSELEILTYFWESAQLYYQKWFFNFGDSNHYGEAGSICYSYQWMLPWQKKFNCKCKLSIFQMANQSIGSNLQLIQ